MDCDGETEFFYHSFKLYENYHSFVWFCFLRFVFFPRALSLNMLMYIAEHCHVNVPSQLPGPLAGAEMSCTAQKEGLSLKYSLGEGCRSSGSGQAWQTLYSEEKESAEMEQSWREGGVRAAESQVPPERKLGGVQEHRAWQ